MRRSSPRLRQKLQATALGVAGYPALNRQTFGPAGSVGDFGQLIGRARHATQLALQSGAGSQIFFLRIGSDSGLPKLLVPAAASDSLHGRHEPLTVRCHSMGVRERISQPRAMSIAHPAARPKRPTAASACPTLHRCGCDNSNHEGVKTLVRLAVSGLASHRTTKVELEFLVEPSRAFSSSAATPHLRYFALPRANWASDVLLEFKAERAGACRHRDSRLPGPFTAATHDATGRSLV